MKCDFSAFCGNFCFFGLKDDISENQDLFICLYCLRDSWRLYFCCFICLSGLCTAGKNAAPQRIMIWHCHSSPSWRLQCRFRACLDSMLCSCFTHAVRAPWQCFRNHQPPLFLILILIFLRWGCWFGFFFLTFFFILADSLVGTATQCHLSFLESCFPFLLVLCFPHWQQLSFVLYFSR